MKSSLSGNYSCTLREVNGNLLESHIKRLLIQPAKDDVSKDNGMSACMVAMVIITKGNVVLRNNLIKIPESVNCNSHQILDVLDCSFMPTLVITHNSTQHISCYGKP